MKFGPVASAEAVGCIAAHTIRAGGTTVKKGATITADLAARLQEAGITEIVAVRLETGDIGENAAAERLASHMVGEAIAAEAPFTGRVNLFAATAGVLRLDVAAIDAFNMVDEAITVATLPALKAVVVGELVATVKIIPYAVAEARVAEALAALGDGPAIAIAPYRPSRVAVISTLLPGLKPSVVDKTLRIMQDRLAPAQAILSADKRVPHEPEPLARAIAEQAGGEADIIVVFGASAITDRRDVIPQALVEAGGEVEHLGMPVDPGNLLMLGRLGGKPVIGAPGCARSPKENSFDWVLQRSLAGIRVEKADVQRMGVGGLLMEIVSRPQPRAPGHSGGGSVAGIVLAAGLSTRMGARNKLLQPLRGKPILRHATEAQLEAGLSPVFVVIGHERDAVTAALADLPVRIVYNPDYASGLASSLKSGIAALPNGVQGAVVSLGDMPNVTPQVIEQLVAAHTMRPEALAVVPTLFGQRGNPVLLAREIFPAVSLLTGDRGARRLLDEAGERVVEVAFEDPAIAIDVDTPEALRALQS
ncbi:molybdopterin-binding/glycosyltransferase family 2 protein [Bosea sp. NBC_00550]|uniref:molybdopterin-binding/glycosyltransferase family 2 protein n=1 Tax=Bosea sp. NBC_00550 TaxID=2969621 RepID=UPI00222E4D88|nr:molybdopterin-binding/glycosyltransferase family 2 protein [Bosea sp. NBC_00550]UZF94243.1 molybdopterin-binding/glycosyltransferase family 2 protein [Bosea sp. NBC_00550]